MSDVADAFGVSAAIHVFIPEPPGILLIELAKDVADASLAVELAAFLGGNDPEFSFNADAWLSTEVYRSNYGSPFVLELTSPEAITGSILSGAPILVLILSRVGKFYRDLNEGKKFGEEAKENPR
jgi:hypothetical protein